MLTRSLESGEKHRNTRKHKDLLPGELFRPGKKHREWQECAFPMQDNRKSKLKSIGIDRKVEICCLGDFMSKKKASGHAEAKIFDAQGPAESRKSRPKAGSPDRRSEVQTEGRKSRPKAR